jgi:archaemetzincin
VFGEATPTQRVALWSLHRFGNPDENLTEFRLSLLRSVKTAVHEAGHVLGMPHCGQFECGMNGTRSLDEHDRRPLEFCQDCQAKIWWACGADSEQRCEKLAKYAARQGWKHETKLFEQEQSLLTAASQKTNRDKR